MAVNNSVTITLTQQQLARLWQVARQEYDDMVSHTSGHMTAQAHQQAESQAKELGPIVALLLAQIVAADQANNTCWHQWLPK